MNVSVEQLGPCKKLLRIEVDAKTVAETVETVTKDFQKHASLAGFRPGKAPRTMVANLYRSQIEAETKDKLLNDSYRKAVTEQKIAVVTQPDVEVVQFAVDQDLVFTATVETAPEFPLPEYKGLPAKRLIKLVTEADVDRALEMLADRQSTFETVARELQAGDIAVVNYTGTSEGKPLTEFAPTAKGLTSNQNFWIETGKDNFIPGFAAQLLGAKAGEHRTVSVEFPADFVASLLSGKKAVYEVDLVEVKVKQAPALDDAFAKALGAEDLSKLREGVRADLEKEIEYQQKKDLSAQLYKLVTGAVQCELPESLVTAETRGLVHDIVHTNQKRGVTRDVIDKEKDNIYAAATANARDRVRASFVFDRIADKENLKISEEELTRRIVQMAMMHKVPPEQYVKELQKQKAIPEIHEQLRNEKVMEFIIQNARIEDVPAESAPA